MYTNGSKEENLFAPFFPSSILGDFLCYTIIKYDEKRVDVKIYSMLFSAFIVVEFLMKFVFCEFYWEM